MTTVVSAFRLVRPTAVHLPACVAALQRGWSADNLRGAAAAAEELAAIAADPQAYLAQMDDPLGAGPLVTLPDGTQRRRIPGLRRWIWRGPDDDSDGFVGNIGLRWMPEDAPLPPHVLGHIGYAVVPWARRQGAATQALARVLPLARAQGLTRVEITTDADNLASQQVITANGGVLLGPFTKGPEYGGAPSLRFVIDLRGIAPQPGG